MEFQNVIQLAKQEFVNYKKPALGLSIVFTNEIIELSAGL
jgi:hypothetical protein